MAIELYFSNRLEELADKFAHLVDLENQVKPNILEGPFTIVPNQNLKKWLQLTFARKQSVFMNVDFQYLDSGLWNLLAGLDPDAEKPEMIDSRFLRMLLLYGLQGLEQNDPELTPLRQYLLWPDGGKGPDYAVKLWQLTEKMVQLFEDYEFHRSEMIRQWFDNKGRAAGLELCQKRLYLLMGELRDRYVQGSGKPLLSMREYADRVFAPGRIDLRGDAGRRPVHVFGLSQVSRFHMGLMGRLKDYYDLFIYALNPCREFWEDIRTPREKRWIQRKNARRLEVTREEIDQGELLEEEGNELLASWGKPGRENIRLLCRLTDYDFNACFIKEADRSSVLGEVQAHILTLSNGREPSRKLSQDRSLQILACPGIYREVETVYNNILYNLENDEKLQLTDIAVLVPDISRYKPVIDSVFNRRPRRLSYNLVDSRADIESVYGQAVLGILELAAGRFSRKEVFDLILNPCLMNKWQIGPEEVNIWAGWAESLNIFHSFDKKAKEEKGYQKSRYYTWKQGLQRLRLSRILSAPADGGGDGFRHFHELVPFYDVNTGDVELMEKFSAIIAKMHRAVKGMAGLRASGEEWTAVLLKICHDLLEVPPDLRGETAVRQSLIEALGDLKIYDALLRDRRGEEGSDLDLGIEVIREFIKSSLRSISGGYGDYLTEGVTISALQPMRPIPFRIIYVLGMEEGAFPGQADASSLDLRLLKRRIGDISLPERNCYLFLEMLLSVRDKLYISYMAKDLQKDRVIQPCSVVNQLRRYVEQEILSGERPFSIIDIPLKGSSERYLAEGAISETSDVLINYSLGDRIALYRERGLWGEVMADLPEEITENVRGFFPNFGVADERPPGDGKIVEKITLKQLKKFLEDPVSHAMKRHLGLYDEEKTLEEMTLKEDEPFYSEFPVDYTLKIAPLKLWLDLYSASGGMDASGQTPEEIYDRVYESLQRNSTTPEGAFAALDRNGLRDDVSARAGTLSRVLTEMGAGEEAYRAFFCGEGVDEQISLANRLPIERFHPVTLAVMTADSLGQAVEAEAELHGQLPWIWRDHEGGWHAVVLTGSEKTPKRKEPDRYILEPLLFWMFCRISGDARQKIGDPEMTFHVIYREEVREWTYAISEGAAGRYLRRLISDYLNREKIEWLPFERVTSRSVKPHKQAGEEIDEAEREIFHAQLRDAYAEEESFLIRLAKPMIPDNAFEKVRDRFQIFFSFLPTRRRQDAKGRNRE